MIRAGLTVWLETRFLRNTISGLSAINDADTFQIKRLLQAGGKRFFFGDAETECKGIAAQQHSFRILPLRVEIRLAQTVLIDVDPANKSAATINLTLESRRMAITGQIILNVRASAKVASNRILFTVKHAQHDFGKGGGNDDEQQKQHQPKPNLFPLRQRRAQS